MLSLPSYVAPILYFALLALYFWVLQTFKAKFRGKREGTLLFRLAALLSLIIFATAAESICFGFSNAQGWPSWDLWALRFVSTGSAIGALLLFIRRLLPTTELEKTRSDDALVASERRFSAFTDQSVDGISVADLDGNYTYVNPAFCKMVGYSPEELLKMTVFDVTSDSQDRASFAKSKGSDVGTPIHVVLRRKNGTNFLAEVVGNIIEHDDSSAEKQSVLGVIRDITGREKAEEQNRELERRVQHAQKLESLGVLAGGIAHDFNNLLTAILGNANLALFDLPPTSPACENIQAIEEATLHAAALAKQMLAYSGKGQFVIKSINAQILIQEMAHLLEVSLSKKIILKYDFGDGVPTFDADAAQIRQIIMNLITNAAEAIGDESGVIRLSTGVKECSREYLDAASDALRAGLDAPLPEGAYAFIEVSDTGCGMDKETIDKIFDPFFTTKFTGRGLGMSAVLGILRGHKSTLKVYSEPGKGTIFRVLFPANNRSAQSAKPADEADEGWRGSGTVLVADDEQSVRLVTHQMLERMGFDVLMAKNGLEAVELYREDPERIVCILLDLTMPEMDGVEAYQEIRRIKSDAKVILCSGYNEQTATQEFLGKGLTGFLHKPFENSGLRRSIRDALETEADDQAEPSAPD